MEAAFFDLDKTVIATSSVMALGGRFYREGLISKRTIVRGIYAQVVYLLLGADDEKMERMREAMLGLTKGWDQQRVSDIVRETLDEVLTPIIYAEALELIEEHKTAGRKTVIISSSPIETVAAARRAPRRRRRDRDARPARRRGPVHRRARVLRVRSAQGRRDPRDGGAAKASTSRTRTPTPTRSPTCRCSSSSAIRSR